jgi:hypothetical protein
LISPHSDLGWALFRSTATTAGATFSFEPFPEQSFTDGEF